MTRPRPGDLYVYHVQDGMGGIELFVVVACQNTFKRTDPHITIMSLYAAGRLEPTLNFYKISESSVRTCERLC